MENRNTTDMFFCLSLLEEQRQRMRLETFVPCTGRMPSEKPQQENRSIFSTHNTPHRKGIVYYELLPRNVTITADIYCQQPRRLTAAIEEKLPGILHQVLLQRDNARPQSINMTEAAIQELGWEMIPHPPYSPDLRPQICIFSFSIQQCSRNLFDNEDTLQICLDDLTPNQQISSDAELKNYQSVGRESDDVGEYSMNREAKALIIQSAVQNLKVRIYKKVILPVLLYGCETWTLTLREEHRLRVFENKVLRKIFGAKLDEVTGEWRKLHNTELHALYSSPDIIRNIKFRRLRWAGHVARMGESRNAYRLLVGKPEGKIPLGRPKRRWEDNIKMDLREVGYDDRDWLNLAQDRDRWRAYVRAKMNLRQQELSRFISLKLVSLSVLNIIITSKTATRKTAAQETREAEQRKDVLFHKNEHFLNATKIRNLLRNRQFDIWYRHPQKGKGVVLFKQYRSASKWICKHEGLFNSEWRDGITMVGNVAAVRAVLGRSQDNRCRHCHNEVETLAHVLGSCPHGEGLRNARHHQVRSIIAIALKDAYYNTFEEVHVLSVTGSTRRIDIIAFKESTRSGFIIDPTVRFETNEEQPVEVDREKKNIYNPTIPYYLQKYQLEELEVVGLLVGARGTATLFMEDVFKRLGIPTSIIPTVTLAALKGSIALLKHHLYSK
ncbi:hypothetical protein ANN_07462 [Periplaneta americana]|uniref:Uncharacterized protein n=1 Tax=Periplaneta americana TaxID=6978 RepID=A0ABQ8T086_PERAM|nr:hypothetical protein ANN_07462 [Periplaneta americana]